MSTIVVDDDQKAALLRKLMEECFPSIVLCIQLYRPPDNPSSRVGLRGIGGLMMSIGAK